MKRYIFPFLMSVLLLGVNKTEAQQAKTITGTFKAPEANTPLAKPTDVNYSMTISPAHDNVSIVTTSKKATMFSIDVLDGDNKIIAHWAPQSPSANCSHSFDISGLKTGSYHLNINNSHANRPTGNSHLDAKKIASQSYHDVSFTK